MQLRECTVCIMLSNNKGIVEDRLIITINYLNFYNVECSFDDQYGLILHSVSAFLELFHFP